MFEHHYLAFAAMRRRLGWAQRALWVVHALLMGVAAFGLWVTLEPGSLGTAAAWGVVALGLGFWNALREHWRERPMGLSDWLLHIDMRYAREPTEGSVYLATSDRAGEAVANSWETRLLDVARDYRRESTVALSRSLRWLGGPVVGVVVAIVFGRPETLHAFRSVAATVIGGAELTILEGAVAEAGAGGDKAGQGSPGSGGQGGSEDGRLPAAPTYALSPLRTASLTVREHNRLRVHLYLPPGVDPLPVLELRPLRRSDGPDREDGEVRSSSTLSQESLRIQLVPTIQADGARGSPNGDDMVEYSAVMALPFSGELWISSIPSLRPLAELRVLTLPLPEVSLEWPQRSSQNGPWHDDVPMFLKVRAQSELPLARVSLVIKTAHARVEERVATIMTDDHFDVRSDYSLILEPYLTEDLEEVEIVAEALTKVQDLLGVSAPLRVQVSSAYGRYRRTLGMLSELKGMVDQAVGGGDAESPLSGTPSAGVRLDDKAQSLVEEVMVAADDSPFFDAFDRMRLRDIQESIVALKGAESLETLGVMSHELNEFLLLHEMLDDRERDRDFFVAARGLTREIASEGGVNKKSEAAIDRLLQFVDERHKRWVRRIERIRSDLVPKRWIEVRDNRPFSTGLRALRRLGVQAAGGTLARIVSEYQAWIESLEEAEDREREQRDAQEQEGLASAKDALRELQVAQGKISESLDKASEREQQSLVEGWPSVRMKQNTNREGTSRVEAELRRLSPRAAARVKAARESMSKVVESGEGEAFPEAESWSDLAGRLLRQAESATSERDRNRSQRRRRSVSGDRYYGQAVVGGDVEIRHEYEVDRRYREDILDDVRGAEIPDSERPLMESYMRRVVR